MGNVPTAQPTSAQQNAGARNVILQAGVDRLQQIYSTATDPSKQTVININPNNVGLVRGFLVKVNGTIHNSGAGPINRSNFGASNALKGIQFTDINNQVRHQTQGWHLSMVNSAKQPMVIGGAYAPNIPVGYGNNYDVMTASAAIAAGADGEVNFYYYVPLSYSKIDLRGAMWAGVVNAVAQLQLEINPKPVVAAGADPALAIYSGDASVGTGWKAGTNVTVTVWQDYIDQIPMNNGQPILPQQDIQTLYQLNNTTLSALVAGQDFGVPFANFRNFLSTVIVYDNGGVFNPGTDVNYFALQTANSSNIWKYGPNEAAFLARTTFLADPPVGAYYFDTRNKPISTQQFGNTQITVNPIAVNANAALMVGYEYFSQASQVVFAGSLPSS
jgi:hypothetical protein